MLGAVRRAFLVVALGLVVPARGLADGAGVYGRFDDRLTFSAGLGGGIGGRIGGDPAALVAADLRLQYLHTAGLAATWEVEPGGGPLQRATFAVDLRPLFLIFVFQNRFSGDPFGDLGVYNLGLEAGAAWDGEHPAFLVGLGTELPVQRVRARGLFLRVATRVLFERERWVGGAARGTTLQLVLALQWHSGLP